MRRMLLLAIAAIWALGGQADAQWTVRKPARSEGQTLRVADQWRSASSALGYYTLPSLGRNGEELRSLSEQRDREFRTLTYAHRRTLPKDLMRRGQWLVGETGDYVWRLRITSPEAEGIALRLEQYRLPEGAALFAYGSGGGRIGALTHRNNSPHGILQLAPLSGRTITLEYELPSGVRPKEEELPPFVVSELQHDFIGIRSLSSLRRGVAKPGEPYFDAIMTLESMSCAPNVVAVPERRQAARSVVVLAIGSTMSSGALINTLRSDGKAYILTAAHNVNMLYDVTDMQEIERLVRGAVIFFGFESPSVEGNIRGTEEMSLSGAELVAYDPETDMAVLEITGLPRSADGSPLPIPVEYNAYFSGWSLSPTPQAPYFGIHHPGILTKRYSGAEDTSLSVVDFAAASRGIYWKMKHWHLKRWAVGSTARGSSGSPLFDASGRIIGALTAGYSYCANARTGRQPEDDYYYAIHRAWSAATPFASLANILDPDGSGRTECVGFDPNAPEALYRLSDLYGADRGAELSSIAEGAEGVGRLITIDGTAKPLGAYLIFKGNEKLDRDFPELVLELRPYDRGAKQLGNVMSEEGISAPLYTLYRPHNDDSGTLVPFDREARSLSRDTIELFVPLNWGESSLPQGEYLLSLRSKSGGALGLPLLQRSKVRLSEGNLWYYADGAWIPNRGAKEQLWLDLLVRSVMPQTSKSLPLELREQMQVYWYNGELVVFLPDGADEGRLRLFGVDGKLLLSRSLENGETRLPVVLPAMGIYVAQVSSCQGERVVKFFVK